METREYRKLLHEAEGEVARLKAALIEAEGVVRFCRRRLQDKAQQTLPLPTGPIDLGTKSGNKSVAEAAAEVIRAARRPLRAGEIAKALVASGWEDKETLPVTITSAIRRRDDLFDKVDRGLFAVKNGTHETEQASATALAVPPSVSG